ncbi:hypothetical protein [Archangium lansingense]|uniref:Uncharacterized protein n=1 Tax=Archangium lansingense TaxID=2995310 RepID=A0ABT4APX9_9BACT|nr:hypothetical protein [Archangium lansinium]MCY1083744.1 hypothetical protein [Archangium lansinium]
MTTAPPFPLASTPVRRFFRPEDLHELFTYGFETLNVFDHARAHLPPEEYAARWSALEEQFGDVQSVLREIAFPSHGQVLTSMEPGHYRTSFNYVAHRQREAAFAVELLSAQTFGGFTHEWLVRSAPATLGPAPWEHLLAEAHLALGLEPLTDMAAPSDEEDPELAAAFLIGLMRQALDNLGCLASQPLFAHVRKERPGGELREDLLVFVRRCLAYATTYRSSSSQPARLLSAAGPARLALRQALESWSPSEDLAGTAAASLTPLARSCLEALELHAPNGDWDAFRGRSPAQAA